MNVFPGNVAPDREGVYVVTTDNPGCWGYFMGYFNGQYWYEYTRANHVINPRGVPRKKCARLAVTAWAEINSSAFSEALKDEKKAPTDMAGRLEVFSKRQFEKANSQPGR